MRDYTHETKRRVDERGLVKGFKKEGVGGGGDKLIGGEQEGERRGRMRV
jgi:hypothetical protein